MTEFARPAPQCHLGPTEHGELCFTVSASGGLVYVEFGTAVRWLGLDPDTTRQLAALLLKSAHEAARQVA